MKICKLCKQSKHESEFYPCKKSSDKLQYECKQCALEIKNKHRQKCREQGILNYSQRTRQRLRLEILKHYGGDPPVCACCGEDHIEFLSIDHIDGRGNEHRIELNKTGGFYSWLKVNNSPPGFRVLCHNCNQSYGHYGYCPHKNPNGIPFCPAKLIYGKKLNEQQIKEIVASSEIQWKLAEKYGVSQQTISRVKDLSKIHS
jgi:hypothetical protein